MPQKTTGAEILARMLDGYGISHVFMVPAVLRRTLAEMERHTSIARIQTHGEKSAVYMADGYARASRRPGLCMAQVVGALNIAAGLRDPWLARSPVIAFTGGRTPHTKFRNTYQEIDDLPAFEPVTKFNATVDAVERIPDLVRQAFRAATSGCPGPVHLQFAGNEGQIDAEEAEMDVVCELDFAHLPPFRPEPEAERIRYAARLLAEAERPVIVAGGGVRASGAAAEVVALAEKLAIPVATSLNGKDTISGDHPLSVGVVGTYSRASANRIVGEADLVFFVGSAAGGMTTHFWQVPAPGTRAIQLDIDPEAVGRTYPVAVGIQGDARVSLQRLLDAVDGRSAAARESWAARARGTVDAWRQENAGLLNSDAVPMRPERICKALEDGLPPDALVLADTGHSGMWTGGMFDLKAPGQSFMRSAGHLGWAFSAGIGAKCALPERPVLAFTGDTGFWYHIAEIETAVRWGVNLVTLVNNNSSGNQSKRGFDRAYGGEQTEKAREMWTFRETNFARIAEEVGALGIRVERPSELSGALDRAFSADRPVVIDAVTDIEALAPLAIV